MSIIKLNKDVVIELSLFFDSKLSSTIILTILMVFRELKVQNILPADDVPL
jgi:hypothetical protein